MGPHFRAGIALLILLLAFSLGIWLGAEAIHRPTQALLEQALAAATAGDLQQAILLADQAKGRWERFHRLSATISDHDPMDETDMLFSEIRVYISQGDKTRFIACCAQLTQWVGSMADAHSGAWWNLL